MNRFYIWLSGKLKGGMGKGFLIGALPFFLSLALLYESDRFDAIFPQVSILGIWLAAPLVKPPTKLSTFHKTLYLIAVMLYCSCIIFILWQTALEYKIWQ